MLVSISTEASLFCLFPASLTLLNLTCHQTFPSPIRGSRRRLCEGVARENSCIKRQNSAVASAKVMQARQLASITRTLLSMSQGKGPMCRLMTRVMYALFESRISWCDKLKIMSILRYELEFWLLGLEQFRSQPIWRTAAVVRVVYSDASELKAWSICCTGSVVPQTS